METNRGKYYVTIGLEIHAELRTASKMFCSCKNPAGKQASDGAGDPEELLPNTLVCPVCMAHPGALPVINKKAIEQVIKVGLALGAKIADFTEFDRKNYFYPDIPKGYQISQYKYPIVSGGALAGMDITRIHLEEDTGNNKHVGDSSLIDFNRAGVPLMELVTEAHTFDDVELAAKTASNFAKEYQLILSYIGASHANMEKGEMRVEANVSISPDKDKRWTQYVEVKNLNSFKSVEKAIKYEAARMMALWEEGKESEIIKETRGFDESKQKTFSQRSKENAEDYRYFPDPDLPKLKLHEAFDLEKMKADLPELPQTKRDRYKNDFGIKDEDIEVYINDIELSAWFEQVANILKDKEAIKLASNYITSDYIGLKKTNPEVRLAKPENFAELIMYAKTGKLSSRATKDIWGRILIEDGSPKEIAEQENLFQTNDEGALKEIVQKIINENPEPVASYKSGKENAIMSLVGKVIKESNGSANPQLVIKLLKEMLASS